MTVGGASDRKLEIAILVPTGVGLGYSGPAVFLKRLIAPITDEANVRVYAGLRPKSLPDPDFIDPQSSLRFSNYGALEQLVWCLTAMWWILRDSRRIDVVHIHGTAVFNLFSALSCLALRIPYVLVPLAAKGDISESGHLSRFRTVRTVRRLIVRHAAGAFALGAEIHEELLALGMKPHRLKQIYNPVSEAFFPRSSTARRSAHTVGFFGVVGPRKRADLVVRTIAELHRRGNREVKGLFVGPWEDGDSQRVFGAAVSAGGLNGVVDHVPYTTQVADIMLNDVSVFVLPSQQEGLPGALTEAMATGLPCVVTDVGAMGDVVRVANSGMVVRPSEVEIADAVEVLLGSASTWEQMSAHGRSFARANFHELVVARNYLQELHEMTGSYGRR
jgi:glycosyltransferase involved in cell wall biosynthesis